MSKWTVALLLPVAAALSAADAAAKLNAFRTYLFVENRIAPPAVKVANVPGKGRGLIATREVSAGEELLCVPRSLSIRPSEFVLNIGKSGMVGAKLAEAGKSLIETPEGASCLLALSLLSEVALGDESRFAPYIEILPTQSELQHPLLWEPSYVESLLKGSHLVERIARLRSDLVTEFEGLRFDVLKFDTKTFPPEVFTVEQYIWAHAIILSRSLPIEEEICLVPLLDMANHESGGPHSWEAVEESVKQGGKASTIKQASAALIAGARVEAGEEVCIDYSRGVERTSWEFLYSYGCVPAMSGMEVEAASAYWLEQGGRPIQLQPLQADDPIKMQKMALLVALGADDSVEAGVESDLRPATPDEMAPLLRLGGITEGNCPELAETIKGWEADPMAVWGQLQRPVNAALEKVVTAQVLTACEEALAPLPPSMALAMKACKGDGDVTEEQERERAVARVLLGERHALEACVEYWKRMEEALAAE